MLPYVDYPVFSSSHLEMGEMERLLEYAAGQGCALTLCTRGESGAWLADGKEVYRQRPYLVEARDTMGGGRFLSDLFPGQLSERKPEESRRA